MSHQILSASIPGDLRKSRFAVWLLVFGVLLSVLAGAALWPQAGMEGATRGAAIAQSSLLLPTPTSTPFQPRPFSPAFSLQFAPPVSATPTLSVPTPAESPTATPVLPEPSPTPFEPVTPTPGLIWLSILPDTPTPAFVPPVTAGGGNGERWIDVDLSEQRLYAYEGDTVVNTFVVSTGTWQYPTVTGTFKIYVKLRYTDMSGPDYYLPDVPYVMYFYKGYGLHGTYWHNNFGVPMSHGCVNLSIPDAAWLYNWASVGTVVRVHE